MSEILGAGETLRMTADRLLVRPLEWKPSEVIHVERRGRSLRGLVIAAGPGAYLKKRRPHPDGKRQIVTETRTFVPMTVRVGDTVELGGLNVFDGQGYNFPTVNVGGVEHIVCQEADVALVGRDDGASEV